MMTANLPRRARVSFPIRTNRPGFIGRSIFLALVVAALGLVSGRTEANEDDRYAGGVPVPLEMSDLLQRTGAARVVVVLRTPDAHRPEGTLPPGLVNAQRIQIRNAQTQVLNSLRNKSHRVLRKYETVPLLALQIGPDALTTLRTSPHVLRLVTDTMNRAFLPQSVPLIQADQLWAGGHDGSGLTVAIIDTGVDASHPFFGGRVIEEACFSSTVPGVSFSFCPDGTDQQLGPGAAAPCPLDGCFHGTHVAGIAAGNGDTAGQSFSGVAKGASIMAVQVFSGFENESDCGGPAPCAGAWTSDLIAALERVYALRATHTFTSANLSLGGGQFTSTCDSEPEKPIIDNLRSAGIATVVAAGNSSLTDAMASPGCISSAVSVGSTTKGDEVSWFSNIASFLSVLAPGEDILSSLPDGTFGELSGTSMATPHVTGAFALLRHAVPDATVDEIQNALEATGLPVTDTRLFGFVTKPRIRIAEALAALEPGVPILTSASPAYSPPGTAPTVTLTGLNLQAGATASFGAGVTVNGVIVDSARQLTAALTISPTATEGPRTVVVTNPNGLSGTLPGGFTVGAPDLSETALSNPPATAAAGSSFTLSDTVRNLGSATAGASTTRYYLSLDAVKSADDVLLVGARSVGTLGSGASSTGAASVTIPPGTAIGTYVLLACADDMATVAESNEANNCVAAAATVQVVLPDLRATAVSNPPASALAGTSFSVTDTVQNAGLLAAGASTTRYYLSLDAVKSADDVLLTGARAVGALNGGATSTGTVNVVIPGGTATGTYRLLACADDLGAVAESDETNNCVASAATVQVGLPDLVTTAVSNPPASAVAGASFLVTDTVQNAGPVVAAATTTRYYLSVDTVKSADDVLLSGSRGVGALTGGATSTGSVNVAIPSTAPAGTYRLLACADDAGVVTESSEANNCLASAGTVQVGQPDLVVSAVSNPPATAVVGAAFAVTDTTQNAGAVPAAATTTRYYLSLDAAKSADDTLLTGSRGVGTLSAGAISTGGVNVVIPNGTAAGTYRLLACADDLGAVAESNETNNCAASATTVQVSLANVVDLVATAVSDPPATALTGTGFAVTDTVQNTGTATAGTSTTRYYLSLDAVKNAGDVLLTGTRGVGALSAGAVSTGTVNVAIPGGTAAGTYRLLACADDLGAVTESNETNNCVASAGTVTVTVPSLPDLATTTVTNPPATAAVASSFPVTDTVQNVGAATAGASTTRYYLSLDTVKNAGDVLLTGVRDVGTLGSGLTSTGTVTVGIPVSTPAGTYRLLACADDTGVVTESDESNNCVASAGTVQVGAATAADLVETSVSNPPTTALIGSFFAVTDTVQNVGALTAGASTTRYYLSLDATRSVDDVLLTGSRGVGALAGGAVSTGTVNVGIPAGTASGTYRLLACADDLGAVMESSETNNCVASAGSVQIGLPDLVQTAVSNPPATATVGSVFLVTDTVQNAGPVAASGTTTRYYLSVDAVKNAGDVLLTGSRGVGTLNGGATSTGTVNVVIPSATPAGTYVLLACADDLAAVTESNETNNCIASTGTVQVSLPDLVTTTVSNPPATAGAGAAFAVTDTVQNAGPVAAVSTTTRYYLSLDAVKNAGDVLLTGSRGVGTLNPGATSTGTVNVVIPSTAAPGTYLLLACADDTAAVTESDETNNCAVSSTPLTISGP